MAEDIKQSDTVRSTSIGGQAVMEGVMMRSEKNIAIAVRNGDGIIEIDTDVLPDKKWYDTVPVVRGVSAFLYSLITGIKTIMRSAEVTDDDVKLSKGEVGLAVTLGIMFAVALFILLPEGLARLVDLLFHNVIIKSVTSGIARLGIFIIYLAAISKIHDIKRIFMYHGAEHKTINCYESGMEMTVANVQSCSTRHNRCGTTFLFIVMMISIFIFTIINCVLDRFMHIDKVWLDILVTIAIKLVSLPIVAGISYETLKGLAKCKDNVFVRALRAPGLALQGMTTAEPDDEMVEVAIASFMAVQNRDIDPSLPKYNLGEFRMDEVRGEIRQVLGSVGADEAEEDWILCEVLGMNRAATRAISRISAKEYKTVRDILARRAMHEPLDYILGNSVFYGRRILVNTNVLIPRMETELVCEKVLQMIDRRNAHVLDLCTGSGCIALTIANECNDAVVTAVDISQAALEVARYNLRDTQVEILESDLFSALEGRTFDVIVSNPPYIPTGVIPSLQQEVLHEPILALDGGEDGLDFYRKIIINARSYLNYGGALVVEIGYDQADSVKRLFDSFGYKNIEIVRDYDRNDRMVIGWTD